MASQIVRWAIFEDETGARHATILLYDHDDGLTSRGEEYFGPSEPHYVA
jgi:hypothetical protein